MKNDSNLTVLLKKIKRKARSYWCVAMNGNHEFYRARTDTKLFQQCLLCRHETNGWTVDRRDRRQSPAA